MFLSVSLAADPSEIQARIVRWAVVEQDVPQQRPRHHRRLADGLPQSEPKGWHTYRGGEAGAPRKICTLPTVAAGGTRAAAPKAAGI